MLVVETIAKIRRGYFVQGKAIKAISRELEVSRKVVRKVIRSGETAFVYERRAQPQPKLGPSRIADYPPGTSPISCHGTGSPGPSSRPPDPRPSPEVTEKVPGGVNYFTLELRPKA
jgi:hypothetical protein